METKMNIPKGYKEFSIIAHEKSTGTRRKILLNTNLKVCQALGFPAGRQAIALNEELVTIRGAAPTPENSVCRGRIALYYSLDRYDQPGEEPEVCYYGSPETNLRSIGFKNRKIKKTDKSNESI